MPDDGNDNDRESGHKDFWDKLRASGTIVVAVVVAAMGGWFNHQQAERNRVSAESQFYTDLLACPVRRRAGVVLGGSHPFPRMDG